MTDIDWKNIYTTPTKPIKADTRPLTPEILTAAGYTKRHENEAVANFEKCVDEVWVEIDWRKRINKIDVQCDECGKEHAQLAEWLQELAAFKDKTLITAEFLMRNGFELHEVDGKPDHEFANLCRDSDYYLYCDDVEEISAEIIDNEMGVWRIEIGFLDHGNTESLDICTVGQLRMFLAIEGLNNIVEQFK